MSWEGTLNKEDREGLEIDVEKLSYYQRGKILHAILQTSGYKNYALYNKDYYKLVELK